MFFIVTHVYLVLPNTYYHQVSELEKKRQIKLISLRHPLLVLINGGKLVPTVRIYGTYRNKKYETVM